LLYLARTRNGYVLCLNGVSSPVHPRSFSGSVPFLLREHLSYSQLAVFALSGYPYSLKLLWSPIVDSIFIPSIGRRKSWIIPMQLIIASLMLYISWNVDALLVKVRPPTHYD
jgi:hypothetical protein